MWKCLASFLQFAIPACDPEIAEIFCPRIQKQPGLRVCSISPSIVRWREFLLSNARTFIYNMIAQGARIEEHKIESTIPAEFDADLRAIEVVESIFGSEVMANLLNDPPPGRILSFEKVKNYDRVSAESMAVRPKDVLMNSHLTLGRIPPR